MKATYRPVPLRNICDLISGQHILAENYNTEGRGYGYLTGPSDFGIRNPIVTKWTEHPKVIANSGDILITVKGSGVGSINLLDRDNIAISRQLMAVRVNRADQAFVHAFLVHKFDELQSMATGAAIPGISRDQVLGLSIPLPPLPEQQRIVGILDEAFAHIATAKANAEKNLQNARALFESHLQSVFSQRGDGWAIKKLTDSVKTVSTGPFGSLLHKSDYVDSGVPLVNPTNIVFDRIVPDEGKQIDSKTLQRLRSYILQEGDIVVGRRGEIGRCAVVGTKENGWLCGTGCFFIRPTASMDSHFIAHLIRSDYYRNKLIASST